MSRTLIGSARDALRAVESDPTRAAASAAEIVRQARRSRDHAAGSVAERVLGLADLHSSDLDRAMRHFRKAIELGRRAQSPELAAQARMSLAFAAGSRGRSGLALREIDAALADLRGVDRARGQVQRGAILQQRGQIDEALTWYAMALPVLRADGDAIWIWRVLNNLGVLHGQRLELGPAVADLTEASRICDEGKLDMLAAFTQQNLGWVHTLGGDIPLALRHFDEAEARLRDLSSQLGTLLRDRCELLLSVHLVSEARAVAEQAVAELRRERRLVTLPEVRLLLARAAVLSGEPAVALQQARLAVRGFSRQDRPAWLALARFAVVSARLAGEHRARVGAGQLEGAAEALSRTPWTAAATEARIVAASVALERGRTTRAHEQLHLAIRSARRGPASLRARTWYATALLRRSKGDDRGAITALRSGLRIIDEHRTTLGATDLRARAAVDRTDLTRLGLRIALHRHTARQVLEWAERGRASLFLMPAVRPPDDPWLSGTLADLRAAVAEADELRLAGRSAAKALARQITLERRVRDHCRRQPGTSQLLAPVPPDELAGALDGAALVEFVELDGHLHAVSLSRGRLRLHPLGPVAAVHDALDRIPFALHRLARRRTTAASRAAARAVLRHAGIGLDRTLLAPLAGELGDASLVLVPTGRLQSLPWSILPSCAGRPVTVAPSATSWHLAHTRTAPRNGEVAVVAGPELPGAQVEARAVAAIHATTALLGSAATAEATKAALVRADLAHLATHGRMSADNPLFSALVLADGPLMVYDIERLSRVPATVVLAACDIGRHTVWAGDELLGLAATFLAQGAQQIIAPVVPVPDIETAPLMTSFHRRLATGRPTAEALASAQQGLADSDTPETAAAAGFVCVGSGLTQA